MRRAPDLAAPATRDREIGALSEATAELSLSRGTIVTLQDEERVRAPVGTIQAIPAWRWCLDHDLAGAP